MSSGPSSADTMNKRAASASPCSSPRPDGQGRKRQRLEDPDVATEELLQSSKAEEKADEPGIPRDSVDDALVHTAGIPSAVRIIKALERVSLLPKIGHCPTKVRDAAHMMLEYADTRLGLTEGDVDTDTYGESLEPVEVSDRDKRNA
ncbi:hypothetical protein OH77DRAFT_1485804, partial [Trametes cingulata]